MGKIVWITFATDRRRRSLRSVFVMKFIDRFGRIDRRWGPNESKKKVLFSKSGFALFAWRNGKW